MKKHFSSRLYPIIGLLLILLVGGWLRFWRQDQAPRGALVDEMHFGYLAYSLIETGADEHGRSWPIIFEGFGDRKLPAYGYALIPFVKIMGLGVSTIRIPSALAGIATIAALYFLLKELKFEDRWALSGAAIVSLSHWSFFISRIGFESNFALSFLSWSLVFLIRGIEKVSVRSMALSGLLMAGTWYSYVAYRPVTLGISAVMIAYLLWRRFSFKPLLTFLAVFALAVLPLFSPSAASVNSTRLKQVGILSDPGVVMNITEQRDFCSMHQPWRVCYALHNKATFVGRVLVSRFFETYSPEFLATFGEKDEEFLKVEHFGQFPVVLYPFFVVGVVSLSAVLLQKKDSSNKQLAILILLGLILSPLPAIVVGDAQKVRLSMLVPFIVLAMVYGMRVVYEHLKNRWLQLAVFSVVVVGFLGQSFLFFGNYFFSHVTQKENLYQSYVPELMHQAKQYADDHLVVIKPYFSDPIMFYAFYNKVNPSEYQTNAVLGELEDSGFQHTVELGNVWVYSFSPEHTVCVAAEQNLPAVLITNEEYEELSPAYVAKSSNGVHDYGYVYDLSGYDLSEANCDSSES